MGICPFFGKVSLVIPQYTVLFPGKIRKTSALLHKMTDYFIIQRVRISSENFYSRPGRNLSVKRGFFVYCVNCIFGEYALQY